MPEIPDVVASETIASEWGNDIRDRTIQRYASAAARTTAHGSPVEGDLSYLNDTDTVYHYNGTVWVPHVGGATSVTSAMLVGTVAPDLFRFFGADHATGGALTTTLTDKASVTLTKPASWTTYQVMAWGHATGTSGTSTMISRVELGANNGTTMTGDAAPCWHAISGASGASLLIALAVAESGGESVYRNSTISYIASRQT